MEDIATQQVGLVENINRDVNFIAAAARLQMGKSGKAVVDALGFDPMEVAKKSREASKAAAEGINSLGNAVTSTINDVTNVEGRKKAQSQTEPQKPVAVAEAEKAKAEAEKAKTQTSNNQSGQKNVNLKVTTDVSGDEFTRLIMKNPDMAGKFFDSWDSYTSVPQ
jgi:hypothetical protein